MKPITLHPVSVLGGLALAAVFTVLAGAAQSHGTATSIPIHDVRLVGEIPAEWWTYVYLRTKPDGTPELTYVVPSDRYLVVTAISRQGTLRVNGADDQALNGLNGSLVGANGTRITISPGSLVETFNGGGGAQAELWGYLEPVR